jgi:hypothetical protein
VGVEVNVVVLLPDEVVGDPLVVPEPELAVGDTVEGDGVTDGLGETLLAGEGDGDLEGVLLGVGFFGDAGACTTTARGTCNGTYARVLVVS